jgi:hypothetical protein
MDLLDGGRLHCWRISVQLGVRSGDEFPVDRESVRSGLAYLILLPIWQPDERIWTGSGQRVLPMSQWSVEPVLIEKAVPSGPV